MEYSDLQEYEVNARDFILDVSWDSDVKQLGGFDSLLSSTWESAMDKGYFKYKLGKLKTRVTPGKNKYVLQLNIERATQRRTPQNITSLNQPFNPELFNFTKINPREILFRLTHQTTKNSSAEATVFNNKFSQADQHQAINLMMINVSPHEFGHCLLVPDILACLPQILTESSLTLVIETVLLSRHPGFRIGFNSLCAFASVNHLHFHAYYLEHELYVDTCRVKHLSGPFYETEEIPVKGFVLCIPHCAEMTSDVSDYLANAIQNIVKTLIAITNYLTSEDIAFNLFITRGTTLNDKEPKMRTIRAILWPRKKFVGTKMPSAFNVALVELSGHIPVKDERSFEIMDDAFVENLFVEFALEPNDYDKIRNKVVEIAKGLFATA